MTDPQARTKRIASVAIAISVTVWWMMRHRGAHDAATPARPAATSPGAGTGSASQ